MGEGTARWRVVLERAGAWLRQGRTSLPRGASPTATIVDDSSIRRPSDALPGLPIFLLALYVLFPRLGLPLGLVALFAVGFIWWAFTDRRIAGGRLVLDEHRLWIATSGRWLGPIDLRGVVAIDSGHGWPLLFFTRPLVLFVPKATAASGIRSRPSTALASELGPLQDVRGLRIYGSAPILSWLAVVAMQQAPGGVVSTSLSARLGIVPGAPPPPSAIRSRT